VISVVVDLETLERRYGQLGELDDGTPLAASILERWLCDSPLARIVMAGRSVPVDLGAVSYQPSAALRRALDARDRGCVIPGCRRKARWCHAHHVVRWPDGPTNLGNLVLLCNRHHKHVHAGVITLRPGPTPARWTACRADGTPLHQRARPEEPPRWRGGRPDPAAAAR
jgi:hypothetical protein